MCPFSVLSYLPLWPLEHQKTPREESSLAKGISLDEPIRGRTSQYRDNFWYYSKISITSNLEEMLKHLILEKLALLANHTGLPPSKCNEAHYSECPSHTESNFP